MPSTGTWNGTSYSIPLAGELNWATLSDFLIDLRNNAQTTNFQKFGAREATSTPVTVSAATDCVIFVNIGSASVVDLPAGSAGAVFMIVDSSGAAATNNITVTPNGVEQINGAANYVINRNRAGVIVAWSGTQWIIVAENISGGATTGTGNLVFSASPTFTGTINAAAATLTGLLTGVNITSTGLIDITGGSGILFNSGEENLSYYDEVTNSSAVFTYQGGNALAATNIKYTRVGNLVSLIIEAKTGAPGVGTADRIVSTNLVPAAVRPIYDIWMPCAIADNGVEALGAFSIQAVNGTATFFRNIDVTGTFTDAAGSGFRGFSASYVVS